LKKGNQTGVGKIDEQWHLADASKGMTSTKTPVREISYLQQDSEDDEGVRHASL
jgi:hypothetical protein